MGEQKSNVAPIVFGTIGAAITIWYFFGGGLKTEVDNEMKKIEYTVAIDAMKQFEIAQRSGSAMDACVQAGIVSAAFLQAKDETHYRKWKEIKYAECRKAGMP